jgi:nitrate reductase NapA
VLLDETTNNMQAGPNINEEIYPRLAQSGELRRGVRCVPDRLRAGGRPDPALRDVDGEGRRLRQRRAPHQFWRQQVKAPGEAKSDLWQYMEFSKRFKVEEVWPAELLAKKPEYKGKTLYDVLYANGRSTSSRRRAAKVNERHQGLHQRRVQGFRLLRAEGPVRGIRRLRSRPCARPGAFDVYHKARGLRWPVVDGKETLWRFREGYDPYVKGRGRQVLRHKDGKAVIFALPYQPPPRCRTRTTTCGCAPAACWSTGIPAR